MTLSSRRSTVFQLQQFSISAFLPPAAAAAASLAGPSKRPSKREKDDDAADFVLSDDDDEQEFKAPAVPPHKRRKKKKTAVLDLSAYTARPPPPIRRLYSSLAPHLQLPTTTRSASRARPVLPNRQQRNSRDQTRARVKRNKASPKRRSKMTTSSGSTSMLRSAEYGACSHQEDAPILLSDLTPPLNWFQDDLSVHARKVTDVENWFNEAYSSNPQIAKWRRVLVLSGPAGAGKTAVVKMLAKDMDAEIVEWQEGQSGKTVDDDPGEQDATLGSSQALCFRYRRTVALIEVDPLPHRPRIARAPVHVLSRSSRDGPCARFRSGGASPFHLDLKVCAAQVVLPPSTSIQFDPPPPPPHPPRRSPQRLSLADETGPTIRRTAVLVLAARDGSARHHRE